MAPAIHAFGWLIYVAPMNGPRCQEAAVSSGAGLAPRPREGGRQRNGSRRLAQHHLVTMEEAGFGSPDRKRPLVLTLTRSYSKLVAAPTFEASHLSNAAWLSTTNMPADIAKWELPQSWAQLIW